MKRSCIYYILLLTTSDFKCRSLPLMTNLKNIRRINNEDMDTNKNGIGILKEKKTVHFIGAKAFWLDPRLKYVLKNFEKERKELGIEFKHIFDYEVKTQKPEILKIVGKPYKFLPQKYSSQTAVDIFGDYVVTFVGVGVGELQQEPLQFVLKSKELANGYRKFFQFMWDHCKDE